MIEMSQTSFAIVADCHIPACEGSAQEAVLRWALGQCASREVVGYHLHQVGGGQAHQPLHTLYGPQLSLASFFWAWQTGQLAPGPMFLEIRGESPCVSWDSLQRGIGASSLPLPLAMHTSVGDPN